jgi:DnaJ family protein C protein 28
MPDIDEIFKQGFEGGLFDDLPGYGKPLKLDENPFEDPQWRLSYHLLHENGFSLPWIETRREILDELAHAREVLERSNRWRINAQTDQVAGNEVEFEWQRAVARYRQSLSELNQKIKDYNLLAPHIYFQLPLLDADKEIARILAKTGKT